MWQLTSNVKLGKHEEKYVNLHALNKLTMKLLTKLCAVNTLGGPASAPSPLRVHAGSYQTHGPNPQQSSDKGSIGSK